jgi:hypothetical protein
MSNDNERDVEDYTVGQLNIVPNEQNSNDQLKQQMLKAHEQSKNVCYSCNKTGQSMMFCSRCKVVTTSHFHLSNL